MAKATSLFKYREFNKSSIELLINRELWFAEPKSLNDPFECQRTYSSVLDATWEKHEASESYKLEIDEKLSKYLNKTGICSFSRTRKNQLMWAHYADEHKGFCIGFNQRELESTREDRGHEDRGQVYINSFFMLSLDYDKTY